MKLARRILMGLGSFALVAAFLIFLAPKTAHAVVATLVQVTNTSTNPVPTAEVNDPGEEPFQTQICLAFPAGSFPCSSGTVENFAVPTVTSDGLTVKRLVVENISGFCFVGGSQTINLVLLVFSTLANSINSIEQESLVQTSTSIGSFAGLSHVSFPTPVYADPGTSVYVGAFNYGETPTTTNSAGCDYNIIGHLVTH